MPRSSTGSTNASSASRRCAMWNSYGNPPRKALAFELSRLKGKHFTTSSAFLSYFHPSGRFAESDKHFRQSCYHPVLQGVYNYHQTENMPLCFAFTGIVKEFRKWT